MFTNKTKSPSVIEFPLGGDNLTCRQNNTHLGVILNMHNSDVLAVEGRKRKFFGAVNSLVARMDGPCLNDCVWKKLVEVQLFPILSYGSHLWNLEKKTASNLVDVSYRKGI